jgi:hypothetical protein
LPGFILTPSAKGLDLVHQIIGDRALVLHDS